MDNFKRNKKFEWYASGNAPLLYPTELFVGDFIFEDGSKLYIPESYPFTSVWGKSVSTHLLDENTHSAPIFIVIIWFSIVENKFYAIAEKLPKEKIETLLEEINEATKEQKYDSIIAGMAPYGGLAIWLSGNGITTEVAWLQGESIDVDMEDFAQGCSLSREEYAKKALENCKEAYKNYQNNGLPDRMLFERYMQKFNYRITPKFENEDAVFEGIELYYYNGELNTTNSGEHVENVMRAKPYKIVLNWSIGKTQYGGYFWTDEHKIIETFANFFNNDMQKAGNLVIEVGENNKQFKFFLQDETTVIEIPVEDIQIMVFKNKFEFFRSENYNKPPQGWRN